MTMRIEVTDVFGGTVKQISGYVHNRDIIVIQGTPETGFRVESSSCLPVDFDKAAMYVECMRRAFGAAESMTANAEITGG